jgi:Activator of Hsp90 ATPase homolog 1-like protein
MSVEPITRSVTVRRDVEQTFRIFTEEIGTWWPVEANSRAARDFEGEDVKVERVEFQTRTGGQVLEHLSNGRTLPWADVLAWDPPRRFVLAWHPTFSERPPTEVEVRFMPSGDGTLVELEHRGWELLGSEVEDLKGGYAAGWIMTLERFRAAVEQAA